MEQVLNLEPGEDLTSLRARLPLLDGDDVVVMVLPGAEALRSPLAARLLRRQAEALGKRLEVVCEDRRTQDALSTEGIPTCTLREYQQRLLASADAEEGAAVASRPRPSRARRGPRRVLRWVIISLLVLLAAGGYFLLPSASVVIVLASETVWENIEVTAALGADDVDVAHQRIPGRTLEATFEGRGVLSTNDNTVLPSAPATGDVLFVNLSGATLVVPEETRVGTASGVWFRTTEPVTLPLQPQATTRASISAEELGTQGNVPAMNIDRLWGGVLAGKVRVFNPAATTGGTDEETPEVTAARRETLRQQVLEKVRRQALAEFGRWEEGSLFVYPEALKMEILEERLEPIFTDGGDGQEMRLRVRAGAIAFDATNAQRLAVEFFRQRAAGRFIVGSDVGVHPAQITTYDDDEIVFQLYTERRQAALPDLDRLCQELAGMSRENAAAHLARGVALARPAWVEVHPSWIAQLPRFTFRIDIQVALPQ